MPLGVSSHDLVSGTLGGSYFSSYSWDPSYLTLVLVFCLFVFFSFVSGEHLLCSIYSIIPVFLLPSHSFISLSGLFFLRLDVYIGLSPAWAALIQGYFFLT